MAKNLRAVVRVFHCPKKQIDGRVKTFEAGSVFAAAELGAEDIKHMLRHKLIEETDDPVAPPPVKSSASEQPAQELATETEHPTQPQLVASLDEALKAEHEGA